MTLPGLILIALSFFLALFCSWVILAPFFELQEAPEDVLAARKRDSLTELKLKKETMLDALDDLEADFLTARLDQPEYERAKDELTDEAAELLSSIDSLEGETAGPRTAGRATVIPAVPRKHQR
ncbi:MAG: hypothetical protein U0136_01000 [Bdellovibrionota bacterium]